MPDPFAKRFFALWSSAAALLLVPCLCGCPGSLNNPEQFVDGSTAADPEAGAPDAGKAPLCDIEADVFQVTCGSVACHGPPGGTSMLDLTSPGVASRVVGVASTLCPGKTLVVAGDPSSSYLMDKLKGTQPSTCGARMPYLIGPLDDHQMSCVEAWIASLGAGDGGSVDGGGSEAASPLDAGDADSGSTAGDAGSDAGVP